MLETVLIVAVVALAAGYALRRALRTLRPAPRSASGCGECGCDTAPRSPRVSR